MDTGLFNYHLPEELIADNPLARGESRMMVLNRKDKSITHLRFAQIVEFIDEYTTVVFNSTKVVPARIFGKRMTGGIVEFLLIKQIENGLWQVMVKCSKKIGAGEKVLFEHGLTAEIISRNEQFANVRFSLDNVQILKFLDEFGDVPLDRKSVV